jgi:hypothetical protein
MAHVLPVMSEKDLKTLGASERAELYYATHPGSPSAVRRPRLFVRTHMWVALLGRNIHEGMAGFGPTVEAALGAFDRQYLSSLRPPTERQALDRAA